MMDLEEFRKRRDEERNRDRSKRGATCKHPECEFDGDHDCAWQAFRPSCPLWEEILL